MQLQQMAASFAQQGVAMEQYLQMTGKTMDSLKDELKPVAQKQVNLRLFSMKSSEWKISLYLTRRWMSSMSLFHRSMVSLLTL